MATAPNGKKYRALPEPESRCKAITLGFKAAPHIWRRNSFGSDENNVKVSAKGAMAQ
jgi:hypothetical protein